MLSNLGKCSLNNNEEKTHNFDESFTYSFLNKYQYNFILNQIFI